MIWSGERRPLLDLFCIVLCLSGRMTKHLFITVLVNNSSSYAETTTDETFELWHLRAERFLLPGEGINVFNWSLCLRWRERMADIFYFMRHYNMVSKIKLAM